MVREALGIQGVDDVPALLPVLPYQYVPTIRPWLLMPE